MQDEPRGGSRNEDRLRRVLTWVLPALLLTGIATAAVGTAGQAGPVDRTADLYPREPGATWTYANQTDGRPTGHNVVQVVGTARLGEVVADVMETRWDDFLGRGAPLVSRRYVSSAGAQVLDHGTRSGDTHTAIEPAMPLLDTQGGRSWEGTIDGDAATAELVDLGRTDLEVSGRAYRSCLHQRAEVEVTGDEGYTSTVDSWTCPGVGVVRAEELFVQGETRISLDRDLVAFSTRGVSFRTAGAPALSSTQPVVEPGATADLTTGRTNAVDGELDVERYAWTTRSLLEPAHPPLSAGGSRMLITSEDGTLSSTDVASGEVAWRVRVRPPVPVAPVVAGGQVLVADGAKGLLALDAETGATRWSVAFPDVPSTSPAVVDDVVVVAFEDRTLRGLDVRDGRQLWVHEMTGRVVQPLAGEGGLVYVADTDGLLTARHADDGASEWELDLGATPTAGPAVLDGVLVVADDQGLVRSVDATNGDEGWQEYRERTVSEQVAVTGSAVALVLDGVELEVLDAGSGATRWRQGTSEVEVPPVVVGSSLAVVDEQGVVSTYDLEDGRRTARRTVGADPGDAISDSSAFGVVDDALVLPLSHRVAGGSTIVAFPIGAGRTHDGARLSRTVQELPGSPLVPPTGTLDDFAFPAAGAQVWRVAGGSPPPAPLASGASSFFAVRAGDLVLHQGEEGLLAARPDSGEVVWSAPMAPSSPGVAPAVVGDAVVIPVQGLALTAYRLADGTPLWAKEVEDPGAANASTPLALPDGDVVYAGGELARYDGETGRRVWTAGALDVFAPLAADADTAYAAGFEDDVPVLVAVDLATGARRWTVPANPTALQGPVVGAGTVALIDGGNVVHGHDPRTGRRTWSTALDGAPGGMPVVLGEAVVVGTKGDTEDLEAPNHGVLALAADDGTFLAGRQLAGNDFGVAGFGRLGDRVFAPSFQFGLIAELLSLEPS